MKDFNDFIKFLSKHKVVIKLTSDKDNLNYNDVIQLIIKYL